LNLQKELQKNHHYRYNARLKLAEVLEHIDADFRLQIYSFGGRNDFDSRRNQWFEGTGLQERDWLVLCDYVFSTDDTIPYNLRRLIEACTADINASNDIV